MSGSAERRFSGRRVVPVVLGLIALAVAGGMAIWFLNRFPNGPIEALTPVDDARVLILRHGYEARRYLHLTMEGEGGARHWSATLFGVQEGALPVATPALASIQGREARGNISTHAYRLDDGSFAFRAGRLGPEVAYESVGLVRTEGDRRYTLAREAVSELHAITPEGGDAFALELPGGTGPMRLEPVGATLYLDPGDGRMRAIDARTGEVGGEWEASFCVTGGQVLAWAGGQLAAVEGARWRPLPVALPPELGVLWACGTRAEEHILLFGDPGAGPAHVVTLPEGADTPRYVTRLRGGEGEARVRRPSGALPAFLWLPDGAGAVAAVDLGTGQIASRHRWEATGPMELQRLRERTLLHMGERLLALEDDGTLGACARVSGLAGAAQLPEGGRLWVWAGAAFVALDPASLAVVAGGAGVVEVEAIDASAWLR